MTDCNYSSTMLMNREIQRTRISTKWIGRIAQLHYRGTLLKIITVFHLFMLVARLTLPGR